jgi:GNAT superfamily N-acetyltransferase
VAIPDVILRLRRRSDLERSGPDRPVMPLSPDRAQVRIVQLRPDQLEAVGEVLSQSHAEYPAFRHIFPDPRRRRRALRLMFGGIARDALRFRSVYAAETADGQLQGVAIWLPPNRYPWSAWRQLHGAGWLLGVLLAAPRSFPTFMRTGTNAARLHPSYRHWYLETMGVAPSAQRLGIGSRLLAPVLELADRDRIDCFLETSDRANVRFYERHSFVVVDDALPLLPAGPTHVAMRRRPAERGEHR